MKSLVILYFVIFLPQAACHSFGYINSPFYVAFPNYAVDTGESGVVGDLVYYNLDI